MLIEVFEKLEDVRPIESERCLVLITEDLWEKKHVLKANLECRDFYGVVVPYIISNRKFLRSGILIFSLDNGAKVEITPLDKPEESLKSLRTFKTILLFVDGISPFIDTFVSKLNQIFEDSKVKILGTGGGFKKLSKEPCLFDGEKAFKDCALLVGVNCEVDVSIGHGWKPIHGPLVVTKSKDNLIYEINGEPALKVYKRALKEIANVEISKENFCEVAHAFPLGIVSLRDKECILRNFIGFEGDALIVASSIPVFSSVFIMKGEKEELIDASCKVSWEVFSKSQGKVAILFDCVSRIFSLGEDGLKEEIDRIFLCAGRKDIKVFGVSGVGNITNANYDEVKFLNKTILMGVFKDEGLRSS